MESLYIPDGLKSTERRLYTGQLQVIKSAVMNKKYDIGGFIGSAIGTAAGLRIGSPELGIWVYCGIIAAGMIAGIKIGWVAVATWELMTD